MALKHEAVTFLLLGTFAAAQNYVDQTFYPADLNSTSWLTNDSIGTYGGIYQAGTYDTNSDLPFGTYDFCFMPHPRADTYQLPGPVSNGSISAQLVFVQYIQRHQRRSPYGVLPGGSYQPWDCSNIEPFLYAGPAANISAQQPMHVYAATYTDPMNPFTQAGVAPPGTCQFPQLTIGGLLDAYQHGQDLWGVYGQKLGLLPQGGPDGTTYFRSSESALTQGSAGGVLRGIWPDYTWPVPLHQQVGAVDTANEGFSCDLRTAILQSIESTPLWYEHLNVTAPLSAALEWLTQNVSTWTSALNGISDDFTSWQCNGYQIPCNQNDSSVCVTDSQKDEIFRAGDWEWNYWYRNNANATTYIQTIEGNFIGEMLRNFDAVRNGTTQTKYVHDFLHDNDVGSIAAAVGITALRWPGLGSNIAFELWRAGNGTLFARVLYSGQPIDTIYGTLDWVTLDSLEEILRPFVPDDIVALCNS